ncbi:isoprenylcysteine carboxyl methyltransferase [Actinoplanes sp. ATCC 53533]|uniref:methyltransferase family protein n=1 Tax=Actinoplanes sp. ATCC 53533 TaxID=1288362 RepID=UPI000F7727F1|nr:isoprenylcysteine carboxylmethyltransferase family protein [Actinoplanes sp. ATCC 53533]RSM74883.1 isoprenylcysteine carboxyl methyltransferase [Actinoplanes sp. ATCC 53533]
MASLALGFYLLGLVLAFGVRSIVQWRRTGDTGLRLDAGRIGSLRWWAKLSFLAALVLGLAGPVAALAGLAGLGALNHRAVAVAGLVLAGAGIGATLLAQLTMGASWRIGVDPQERTALVTASAFAVVRNPIFTAMIVTSAGLALMVPNVVSLAATVVLIASIQVQVRAVEEPYLVRTHGQAYTDYAARVGRFLPGLTARSGWPTG